LGIPPHCKQMGYPARKMKKEDFVELLKKLRERPVSGRKLFVWVGDKQSITDILPAEITNEVDLLQIIPDESCSDDANIQRELRKIVRETLQQGVQSLKGQQVLLVSNSWVLARYKVPLSVFYKYYLGDRTLVVLQVDKSMFSGKLPEYVRLRENITLEYFRNLLPEENKDNIIERG
ncbi:hypothetical protein HKBW3S42_00423, partial [Candidatus Hakubella thermalkaliphila]